jgi:GNAT superfamily N-acetyltransferase
MSAPSDIAPPSAWPWSTFVAWRDAMRRFARWVPIRHLKPGHRERIACHLRALNARDRYLRFGYPITDEQILRYVDALDFERDDLFGIFNRRLQLIAMAHLAALPNAESRPDMAEFGVSVAPEARGRGYGARLFDRAVLHARNRGCERLLIHALSENTAMLKIAANAGATVQRDGPDSQAWLQLPAENVVTQVSEIVEDQAAELNYRWKQHALGVERAWSAWGTSTSPSTSGGEARPANTQTGDSASRTDR